MSYNPPADSQDLRGRFDPLRAAWVIEQQTTRLANGRTDAGDLAAILTLNQETWEFLGKWDTLLEMTQQMHMLADTLNVRVREIDTTPLATTSAQVQLAKAVAGLLLV